LVFLDLHRRLFVPTITGRQIDKNFLLHMGFILNFFGFFLIGFEHGFGVALGLVLQFHLLFGLLYQCYLRLFKKCDLTVFPSGYWRYFEDWLQIKAFLAFLGDIIFYVIQIHKSGICRSIQFTLFF
jgi:hypothetical protein